MTYAQKSGFWAGMDYEPQGYFQKPGFSSTLRQSCLKQNHCFGVAIEQVILDAIAGDRSPESNQTW
jgi:hypothetical protein